MPVVSQRKQAWFGFSLLLALGLFVLQSLFLYGSTARDDAFLTYWPAYSLADMGAILNYNGERVEQSSTLLHTLWLALLATLLPFPIPALAWATSLAAALLSLLLCAKALQPERAAVTGVVALSTLPALLYWGNSGMETTVATCLFTGLALCLSRQLDRPPALQLTVIGLAALLVLVRPETFLVLLCFAGLNAMLLSGRTRLRAPGFTGHHYSLLAGTLLAAAAVSLFRFLYFGELFPQPVSAKHVPAGAATVLKGLFYLWESGGSLLARLLLGGGLLAWLAAWLMPWHPRRLAILLCGHLILAQLAFILATGGDWMEASRFVLPVLPVAVMALFWLLSPWRQLPWLVAACLLGVGLYDSVRFAQNESTGFARWERANWQHHYLAGATPGPAFSVAEQYTKDALRDLPQLQALQDLATLLPGPAPLQAMSIQMGFIPYHLSVSQPGRWHFLDLRALSTPELTRCQHTSGLPRSDTGVKLSYDDFFVLLPRLQADCGIRPPDVIYDMGWKMRKDVLARHGYQFVYVEPRLIRGDFSRRAIGSDLFIAVRSELAQKARLLTVPDEGTLTRIQQRPTASKPNLVLLIGDDISYDSYGFTGNAAAVTPTIDQLARAGVVFTDVQSPSAFCRPTLGSFLTGQWPHQSRLHANNGVIALPPGYPTLASLLQQQGYATFAGGKFWEDEPNLRGFTAFDTDNNRFARENQDALWQFLDTYAGHQPFFVWWAPKLPHTPHNPPQAMLDRIDPARIVIPPEITDPAQQVEYRQREHQFLAMTAWLDEAMQQVITQLSQRGLLDQTVVIYLADNGFSHRAPSKSTPYELGLRTPMIVHWPAQLDPATISTPVSSIHLYATLLDLAGRQADPALPSRSLLPVLRKETTLPNEPLFGASYQAVTMKTDPAPRPERDIFALHVRDGDWKYILYLRDLRETDNADLTIKSGMQPFPSRDAGDEELFHLPDDPVEQHNLIAEPGMAAQAALYRAAVLAWWKDTGGLAFDVAKDCPTRPARLCERLEGTAAEAAAH